MDKIIKEAEEKMGKSLVALDSEFQSIRAGRANPNILNRLTVSYYGVPTPVRQLANISVPEARIIEIKPYDRSSIKDIEKAIMTSDIGINPNNDGTAIRLVFPELTKERREELAKDCKKKAEGTKVAIRNIRRDANDALKKLQKGSEITEDDVKNGETKIQKYTDKYIKEVDDLLEVKTKEIMTV